MASVIHMLYGIFFAFKLRKLFSICDFSRAKDSGKVLNIIICYFYNFAFIKKLYIRNSLQSEAISKGSAVVYRSGQRKLTEAFKNADEGNVTNIAGASVIFLM